HDKYYARVLAYGPDPLLIDWQHEPPSPPEPPLPIDDEPIRRVEPGQGNDFAGLNAMSPLTISAASDRHYMLELPDGIGSDDPRLFGFFVYELRLGHDRTRWCTALGRWGQPLRITGVQHPAPQLRCSVARTEKYIVVSAPFAMPMIDGLNAR